MTFRPETKFPALKAVGFEATTARFQTPYARALLTSAMFCAHADAVLRC